MRQLFTRFVANHALYSWQATRTLSKICTLSLATVISAATPVRGDQVMGEGEGEGDSKAVSTLETEAPPVTR